MLKKEQKKVLYLRQKSAKCSTWVQSQKNDRMISVCFQSKPFNITVIQVFVLTNDAAKGEVERFYENLQDLLELMPKKNVLLSFSS